MSIMVHTYVTLTEKELFEKKAKELGLSLSRYLRMSAIIIAKNTKVEWNSIVKEMGLKCKYCGSTEKLVRHHISYEPEIIEIVCVKCHVEKHQILLKTFSLKAVKEETK